MLKSLVSTQFRSAAAAFGKFKEPYFTLRNMQIHGIPGKRAQSLRLKSTEASDDARKAYREFLKSKSVNEGRLQVSWRYHLLENHCPPWQLPLA